MEKKKGFDILFLGRLYPKGKEAEIKSKMKTGMQDAANALQWNIINGLDENECGTIKILDYLPIDSYPRGYTERSIREYTFQHTNRYQSNDKVVGCTNLTIIKQFANRKAFLIELRKWIGDSCGRPKVLMLYTASRLFLTLAQHAKHLDKNIITCCIIADIPEFSSAKKLHGIRKRFNDYETKKTDALYRYIDKFVLLTNQMAERLNITVPYTIMEGIAPEEGAEIDISVASHFVGIKYILYTGTLNYEFGIGVLLDAFSRIPDKDVRLLICGFGEAEQAIKNTDDTRVVFLGKLDRSQVIPLQRGATVLVNPRQNNEVFTKYSFPSKTMEYLASGVPVVAYKLDGIPSEYDEYIRYVSDNSPETLARVLKDVCDLPEEERKRIGSIARKFVLEEKNASKQGKKILDLLSR